MSIYHTCSNWYTPLPCMNVTYVFVRVNGPHLIEVFRSVYTTDPLLVRQSTGRRRSSTKNKMKIYILST